MFHLDLRHSLAGCSPHARVHPRAPRHSRTQSRATSSHEWMLLSNHPYEEVAYDIIPLLNTDASIGSGLIGELPEPADETAFLQTIKTVFGLQVIRHTGLCNKGFEKK